MTKLTEAEQAFYEWYNAKPNASKYVLIAEYREAFMAAWDAGDEPVPHRLTEAGEATLAEAGPAEVRHHRGDDIPEGLGVCEPVAVVICPDDSIDVYGYVGVVDQRPDHSDPRACNYEDGYAAGQDEAYERGYHHGYRHAENEAAARDNRGPCQPTGLWVRSSHGKCLDPPEGCGAFTQQWQGRGEAILHHLPGCPVAGLPRDEHLAALMAHRRPEVAEPEPETDEPQLLDVLREAGKHYGPLGVALVAARLSDPKAVIAQLQERPGDPEEQIHATLNPEPNLHLNIGGSGYKVPPAATEELLFAPATPESIAQAIAENEAELDRRFPRGDLGPVPAETFCGNCGPLNPPGYHRQGCPALLRG